MKHLIIFLSILWLALNCPAQSSNIASLQEKLRLASSDTARSRILAELGYFYRLINPDSGIALSNQSLSLARASHFPAGEASALNSLAQNHRIKGDLIATMPPLLEALLIAKDNQLEPQLAEAYLSMGNTYVSLKDYPTAVGYMKDAIVIYDRLKIPFRASIAIANLGEAYMLMNNLDSAKLLLDSAQRFMTRVQYLTGLNFYETRMAQLMFRTSNYDSAFYHIQEAELLSVKERNLRTKMMVTQLKADYFRLKGQPDSSIHYAEIAFQLARQFNYRWDILASVNKLADLYKGRDLEKAYYYAELTRSLNDSVYGPDIVNQLQRQIIRVNAETQAKEAQLLASQNKIRQTLLLGTLVVAGLILFWLYRTNRKDRKLNAILAGQKDEIERQKKQVEQTLQELRNTQAQLIQTEKMASLGELTAGIAHEIQNPLNFVNNFSDVSTELLQELIDEANANHPAAVKEISSDLLANLEKINHHGKRAEAIVKSMLQHARPSSGLKEPADLNQICDESVRLAWQGFKSKEAGFSAALETRFDPEIGMVSLVASDISRVLINLANNAFHAVQERSRQEDSSFTPVVSVSTSHDANHVFIDITDNGNGIPPQHLNKIFQPFFTTKPTGQGTGLGLSISFDIIKAHGGNIQVKSIPREDTTFIIQLPHNNT